MASPAMEADKMLDIYIQDYLVKRRYINSAKAFQKEAQLSSNSTAIDIPGSFLLEWWSVFWDVFIARYKRGAPNHEALIMKANEQLQQQHRLLNPEQQWLQQLQLQLFLQQQGQHMPQQYQGDKARVQHGTIRNSLAMQNAIAHSMNKEDLNLQNQQPMQSENSGQVSKANHVSILRSAVGGDQPPEMLVHKPVGNLKSFNQMKDRRQHSFASEDLKNSMTPLNPIASGSNLAVNTSPLKGWPLVGLDQLQPGLSHQKKYLPHPDQSSQLQLHQQIRAILTGQNIDKENIQMDSEYNCVGNDIPNVVPVQVGLPILSHGDAWMPKSTHCEQQYLPPIPMGPLSQNSNYQPQLPDRIGATGSTAGDVPISNICDEHDEDSQDLILKKRKQPMPAGDPANTKRTANTIASNQILAPSSPSTHTTNDIISLPDLHTEDNSSKADLVNAIDKGSLKDDVDSFLSCDNPGTGRTDTRLLDTIQGITFSEIATICGNRVKCCGLSLDGKVIATGGDDKRAALWCTESRQQKCELEHSGTITDICFGPKLPRLATSSLDKTVKIWNVDSPGSPHRTFVGHNASVLSVDFHPKKEDLVCSCDDDSSIRYWSVKNGGCTGMLRGCATQVRFEPTCGRYLAASVENGVSIIDVETMQTYRYPLKGHAMDVLSVCWNSNGEYLASLSEDSIRVWKIGSWGLENCMYELTISNKRFRCCVFHPHHSSLLVIGFNESLELWHMAENKVLSAFRQPTHNLAVSKQAGLVASVNDGDLIKLWK